MSAVPVRVKHGLVLFAACLAAVLATSVHLAAQDDPALWYENETFNPGLDTPAKHVDRSSPRAALGSFVDLAEKGDHGAAAHVLILTDLPDDERKARGSKLAAKLASIIDRKLRIDWACVPAEPDGRATQGANGQKVSEPRRDYLLEEFDVNGQIHAIRLARHAQVTAEDEAAAPVWLLSRDTVDSLDVLYDAFGPRAFEAQIPDAMKARVGWLQIWE